jgi:3-oxo-5-alpha-steroid 4-dehydrogenase 1
MDWYTGNATYDTVLFGGFVLVALILIGDKVAKSSYGRFGVKKLGVDPRLGWFLMELPATVVFLAFFVTGTRAGELVPIVLCVIWLIHYANRGWYFPLRIRVNKSERRSFGLSILLIGVLVTVMHGYLNATFWTDYGDHITKGWLTDPRFIIGVIIYYCGFILTVHSERIVRNLRDPKTLDTDEVEYKIPYGGGFKYVSSPTYLGEIIAWAGFAMLTWSLAGVLIFCITAANLVPRAFNTHKWYQEKFEDYPEDRKALIPFLR